MSAPEEVAARLAKYEERLREAYSFSIYDALLEVYPNADDPVEDHRADLRAQAAELAILQAQRYRLAGALERLGSMEAFVSSRMVTLHDDELLARIDYARAALTNQPEHREKSE